MEIPPEQIEACLDVLQRVADSNGTFRRTDRFNSLVSKVYREGKRHDQNAQKRREQAEDRATMASTAMVQIQRDALPAATALLSSSAPAGRRLNQPESCYICKDDFTEVHFFYHLMCPKCAAYNYEMAQPQRGFDRAHRPGHRRAGQDRAPDRATAASRWRKGNCRDALPERRRAATVCGAGFSGLAGPRTPLRSRPA